MLPDSMVQNPQAIMPSSDLPSYTERLTAKEINEITNKLKFASETRNGVHWELLMCLKKYC